ncbi:SDR family oxidoreductase [Antrihabitans cavernicola]|uniref:NAD-dependent epimerase/dehydratase family protein n=1 Tax=Antrihabitans cavernicola TaxID=2495913 RepID=A0A5A7SFM8_9NOCA|nr:NAD(P)H-binding protein [Spelaeibacter cavernicola]KAA0023051.1 NAD-dependent epimerase/dehydratase family protein [Spelaeibacter cavernicola]
MHVAVIGGTGGLGAHVVSELLNRGHQVRVVSRSAPDLMRANLTHRTADLSTGVGLDAAFDNIDTVVDAVNSQKQATAVLVDGLRRVLDAEVRAGVGHHVEISIVGCDRIPIGYYRAKVEQEKVLAAGPVPWTLLRATQFHSFVDAPLAAAAKYRISPHSRAQFQPIDVGEVAARLADAVDTGPSNRVPDIGGPTVYSLTELAEIRRAHHDGHMLAVHIPLPGKAGRAMREGAACLDDTGRRVGSTYEQWLADATLDAATR